MVAREGVAHIEASCRIGTEEIDRLSFLNHNRASQDDIALISQSDPE